MSNNIMFVVITLLRPILRKSTIRFIDTPTTCPDAERIIVPQSIDDCQSAWALAMFTRSVTSASNSGSVIGQCNQYSLILITFYKPLNKISEIMGPAVKHKANAKIYFVKRRIANRRIFVEPTDFD
jgi:hypothetical protein